MTKKPDSKLLYIRTQKMASKKKQILPLMLGDVKASRCRNDTTILTLYQREQHNTGTEDSSSSVSYAPVPYFALHRTQ